MLRPLVFLCENSSKSCQSTSLPPSSKWLCATIIWYVHLMLCGSELHNLYAQLCFKSTRVSNRILWCSCEAHVMRLDVESYSLFLKYFSDFHRKPETKRCSGITSMYKQDEAAQHPANELKRALLYTWYTWHAKPMAFDFDDMEARWTYHGHMMDRWWTDDGQRKRMLQIEPSLLF